MTPVESGLLGNCDQRLLKFYHPVARSQDLQNRPIRVRLIGQDWVIFRTSADADADVVAFLDRCPHRNAPLSLGTCVESGIECAYHGWRFSNDGDLTLVPALGVGAVLPSKAKLIKAAKVTERYGLIFLAPLAPSADLLEITQDADPSFMSGSLSPIDVRQHAGYLADNFLDMAHFPFLHRATFGNGVSVEVDKCDLNENRDGFTAFYSHLFSNFEDQAVQSGVRSLLQRRDMLYRYQVPFAMSLNLSFVDAGGVNVIGFFIAPVDESISRLYTLLWRNDLDGDESAMNDALIFERKVLDEDLWLHEKYNVAGFALDVTLEVHTKADKITLAMRRKLKQKIGANDGL